MKSNVSLFMLIMVASLASCNKQPSQTSTSGIVAAKQAKDSLVEHFDSDILKQKAPHCPTKKARKAIQRKYEDIMIDLVEYSPSFPGGRDSLMAFIKRNTKYPPTLAERKNYGTVFVQFTVDTIGDILSPKIVRGVTPELDREAIRVVRLFPKWSPGYQMGIKVKIAYTVPVKFNNEEATLPDKNRAQTPQQ